MGLDITAHIISKKNAEIERQYIDDNWMLVQNDVIDMDEYIDNYPKLNKRNIDPEKYSIRNFYGLTKFFENEFFQTVSEENPIVSLCYDEVKLTYLAAKAYAIPNIDRYSYKAKCDMLADMCEIAMNNMDKNNDMVEFVFSM